MAVQPFAYVKQEIKSKNDNTANHSGMIYMLVAAQNKKLKLNCYYEYDSFILQQLSQMEIYPPASGQYVVIQRYNTDRLDDAQMTILEVDLEIYESKRNASFMKLVVFAVLYLLDSDIILDYTQHGTCEYYFFGTNFECHHALAKALCQDQGTELPMFQSEGEGTGLREFVGNKWTIW